MTFDLLIQPRDPAMFRDGRPFSAGLGAKSIGWPMPSTVAGHARTRLWQPRGFGGTAFRDEERRRLLEVRQTGPFLACENEEGAWELAFPAPADAAVYRSGGSLKIVPLRPSLDDSEGHGCDLPDGMHPLRGARAEKVAEDEPVFWTAAQTLRWLKNTDTGEWSRPDDQLGYAALPEQGRIHVQIREDRRNAADSMLFRTVSREFDFDTAFRPKGKPGPKDRARQRAAVYTHLTAPEFAWSPTEGAGPLGGERRVARWSRVPFLLPPAPVEERQNKLLRIQLVTPAIFEHGWMPGWMAKGEPPECAGLRVELVAAAIPRHGAVSGFDMAAHGKDRLRGTRFLAQAGSVYFLRVKEGDSRQLWLKSVCDNEQDRRDGFGIVLTGGWKWR